MSAARTRQPRTPWGTAGSRLARSDAPRSPHGPPESRPRPARRWRVAALLGRAATRPRAGRAAAAVLLACLALSGAAALDATYDLHSSIEIAQGENP
ncbi:hypothetical protein [Streptomyces poriferorum]|uniref:hypothetical protein n=1 Tax=Streptomyces poriferorum TaxID=2798799 RepID=UPI001F183E5B|nr:hypothetical protein [Streptomyces poriferorum]